MLLASSPLVLRPPLEEGIRTLIPRRCNVPRRFVRYCRLDEPSVLAQSRVVAAVRGLADGLGAQVHGVFDPILAFGLDLNDLHFSIPVSIHMNASVL